MSEWGNEEKDAIHRICGWHLFFKLGISGKGEVG